LTGRAAAVLATAVAFLAAAAPPALAAPTITEPATDGQVLNPADVHMVAEGFRDGWACTDWEIAEGAAVVWRATCATGDEKVHIHLGDGAFEGSHAGRTELFHSRDYVLRVREGDDTAAEWATRPFVTSAEGPPGRDSDVPWTAAEGYGVERVAGGFRLPVNIAFVPDPGDGPDDPFLYVTELYGTIKVVTRSGEVRDYATGLLNFEPTGNFPGSGEHGLTGIAVEPGTGDVFAALVHAWTENEWPHSGRVVRFHSTDGGLTAAGPPEVVLDLYPETQGASHQISNVSFGPDGMLYVHNGDSNEPPETQDVESYKGKILRLEPDGDPPTDNPFRDASAGETPSDFVWAMGMRNPFGGAWRASDGLHYQVENGPAVDRFADVVAGRNFGWNGSDASMYTHALYNWSPPHAPVNVAFVEPETAFGSGFPEDRMDHAFVTESGPTWASGPSRGNGKRITELVPSGDGTFAGSFPTAFAVYVGTGRATVSGLAAGPDGLYFTDLYKDQGERLAPDDRGANLLRVRYGAPPTTYEPPGGSQEMDPPREEPLPALDVPPPPPPELPGPSAPPLLRGTVAPVVSRFRARRRGRTVAFLYRLSEAATVRVRVARVRRGGRRVPVRTLTRTRPSGASRTRRLRLAAGRHVATIVARDGAGNRSRARTVRFRVLGPRRRER
jgi:glucose/arabinose dehydrogenase